jgi:hypothetical protein
MIYLVPIHQRNRLQGLWSRLIFVRTFFYIVLMSSLPAFAEPVPEISGTSASRASVSVEFVTVSELGDSVQLAGMRTGKLLSRRRATDPFGDSIRGPFKGLPPVVEHPSATPGQPDTASQTAAVNLPTLERAVQELSIGAVNVETRELLIKSRVIREGDLLVLESGGSQFVVWVQSVGARGVLFCDIDLKNHILKSFGSAPTELPGDAAVGLPEIGNVFNQKTEQ